MSEFKILLNFFLWANQKPIVPDINLCIKLTHRLISKNNNLE